MPVHKARESKLLLPLVSFHRTDPVTLETYPSPGHREHLEPALPPKARRKKSLSLTASSGSTFEWWFPGLHHPTHIKVPFPTMF